MFAMQKQDPVQKKAHDHDDDVQAKPEAQESEPVQAKASHGATAQGAAPAMSQWAEGAGVQMKSDPAHEKPHAGHGADKKPDKPAGPHMVHDERFSEDEDVVQDGTGRIIGVSVEKGMTKIMIGMGRKQGVRVGMEGYIKKGNGMLADFQIESTSDRIAYAHVDVTPDAIQETGGQVVVNPSSKPASAQAQADMKARIVGLSIVDGKTQMLIGRGTAHGVSAGMHGYIHSGSGKKYMSFEVSEAGSRTSKAIIGTTIDDVRAHSEVVLNPSH